MNEETKQMVGNNVPVENTGNSLDQSIIDLIKETGNGTWLEGLLNFEDKLSTNEKKLTPYYYYPVLVYLSDDEYEKELERIAEESKMEVDKLKEYIGDDEVGKNRIIDDVKIQKAIDLITDSAVEK